MFKTYQRFVQLHYHGNPGYVYTILSLVVHLLFSSYQFFAMFFLLCFFLSNCTQREIECWQLSDNFQPLCLRESSEGQGYLSCWTPIACRAKSKMRTERSILFWVRAVFNESGPSPGYSVLAAVHAVPAKCLLISRTAHVLTHALGTFV